MREIRCVHVTDGGWWAAYLGGAPGIPSIRVHKRYGSWMTMGEFKHEQAKELLPPVAADLQAAIKTIERRWAEERVKELAEAAASGRVPARLTDANPPASRGSNAWRVPSRLW